MTRSLPIIAILGASGLIGEAVAVWLSRAGFSVVAIARRFSSAQHTAFGSAVIESKIVDLDSAALDELLDKSRADIVVNCIGILQDGPGGATDTVHREFVERLVSVLAARQNPGLLVHVSIPGTDADDRTPFSRTKREGERIVQNGSMPFVILRPAFVIASVAYGSSALIRALAMLPFKFPQSYAQRPFAATAASDVARTIAFVAERFVDGERRWSAAWEVMAQETPTVGDVVDAFRQRLGGPKHALTLPSWLLRLGARAGDLVALLGWSPPIRSTALEEMRRGVAGDPGPWIAATGIEPLSLAASVRDTDADVQEKWFARLYLLKPMMLASLVMFWALSGLIALTVAFDAAMGILTSYGFSPVSAKVITMISSLINISVGVGIAFHRTSVAALVAGICVSIGYMIGAAILTPDLWVEPLGALVKTGPAIVLMLVALAIFEGR
jgi:uncharacterized protein YbjT (DUF2867 family)